jgi:NitT/TauT family transport system substrate-binding protein
VLPIANPDQLTLFLKKSLDAAWAPEPWATRLVQEGHGRMFLDERQLWPGGRFATTVVLVRKKFLDEHPDLVKRWLAGHAHVTRWIQTHPTEARAITGKEIQRLTTKALPEPVLVEAWKHLEFTTDPVAGSITTMAQGAYELGFLRETPDVAGLVDLKLLKEVIR